MVRPRQILSNCITENYKLLERGKGAKKVEKFPHCGGVIGVQKHTKKA
jgi:hypothetical protein